MASRAQSPVVVAVDANGADLGPAEVAAGAALAASQGVSVMLFGPAAQLGTPVEGVQVIDAPVSIAKVSDPMRAARSTPEASIVVAARAVADGRAQALVSGGSTGTALAAGLMCLKRARGIHRPALALALPVPGHPVTLLDVGANTEARPEHLVQFAFLGAGFAHGVLGVPRPRVALLSNGEEGVRGSPLVIAAHTALRERAAHSTALEFVGNVEGTGLMSGAADVVVCDGFTGNVALKLVEAVSETMIAAIREAALSTPRAQAGGALLRPALRGLRDRLDPEEQGGAYLLGLRQLSVIAHGRFGRRGFARAIERAAHGVREDVVGATLDGLRAAGALRGPPVGPGG